MALLPTIPTSFVPHAAGNAPHRPTTGFSGFTGAFGFFAYAALGLVFALAIGVFFYGQLLKSNQKSKDAALVEAVKGIDQTTVEEFVRLRDRLTSGNALLGKHVAFSGFFSALERLLPGSVRFTALNLSMNEAGVPKIEGTGVAKSFNALAAASNAFAADGRIKDAIFSNISVNKDGSVSFALSAALDPKIITFSPSATMDAFGPDSTAPLSP